ncbi:hypothetical protein PVL29_000465 [Vitis rotundifolia]|uniref:Bet v I/Major latex protein domain-containing protein n=1 Tax=Vitis rotundifolia TaxID=103349 RepID=A0AA39AIY4_VITRO|nr:hypothetical protein PVL29_000465 [Vitis rotundifolia]
MALTGKLEVDMEINSPADKFYNIFRRQAHHIPNICSDKVHQIDVHEGDWETPGSVKNWGYTLGGTSMSLKETVESVDDENKLITFKVLDGEIMNHFKSFKSNLQVKAKDEGSLVKWTLEYEKVNEDVPNPDAYLEFAVNVTKDIESHHLKA